MADPTVLLAAGGDATLEYDDCPWDGDDDEDEWGLINCAMGPDGQCGHAGTEWCDWECPIGIAATKAATKLRAMTAQKESGGE